MPAPTLVDGPVTLRAPRPDDAQGSWEQCQDPDSQRFTMAPVPYTHADAREFVTQVLPGGWDDGSDLGFVLEVEGRYAGSVSLRPQGPGQAEIGYGTHPWVRGTGHVERALRLLLAWGFDELGLDAVIWRAHTGNWASRKVAHRLGFRVEGTVRRLVPQRGELRDAWIGSLLRDDPREAPHPWLEAPTLAIDHGADGVRLRPLHEADLVRVVEACRDPETQTWLEELPADYDLDDARAYLDMVTEWLATSSAVVLGVAAVDDDRLLGTMGLMRLVPGRSAELGYWTHPDARGRGTTAAAARRAVRWALDPEGLDVPRVWARVSTANHASRRVLRAAGLTPGGVDRAASRRRDGTVDDLERLDVLRSDLAGGAA